MTRRSRSAVFFELGSQTCASLVIGKSRECGTGPDHFTFPEIVPPSVTVITLYSLCASADETANIKIARSRYGFRPKCISPSLNAQPGPHDPAGRIFDCIAAPAHSILRD